MEESEWVEEVIETGSVPQNTLLSSQERTNTQVKYFDLCAQFIEEKWEFQGILK